MFSIWIVVMVSWMYVYVQTHQEIYIKYVQFSHINYTSIKHKESHAKYWIILQMQDHPIDYSIFSILDSCPYNGKSTPNY